MKIKWMKLIISCCIGLLLIGLLISNNPAIAKEPYKVGVLGSFTGPYGVLLSDDRDGAILAGEEINKAGGISGHLLELIVMDDRGEATIAATAARKSIQQDKVVAIWMSGGSASNAAVVPITDKARIPQISELPTPEEFSKRPEKAPWNFVVHLSKKSQGERLTAYCKKKGYKNLVLLYDISRSMTDNKDNFVNALPSEIKVLAIEGYKSADTDMTAQLITLKGKNADALVIHGSGMGGAIAIKNAKQIGLTIPILGISELLGKERVACGGADEGVVAVGPRSLVFDTLPAGDPYTKIVQQFRDKWKARWGRDLGLFSPIGYDRMMLLSLALKKAGPEPSALRKALEQTDYKGVFGPIKYSPTKHEAPGMEAVVIMTIKDGKLVFLEE